MATTRRPPRAFIAIISVVILVVTLSGILNSLQILRLTQNNLIFQLWISACILFQTPIIIVPLDRGRLIGFFGKVLPQFLMLFLIAWNISQILLLPLMPFTYFIPADGKAYEYFPFLVLACVLVIVFRSVFNVVEKKMTLSVPNLPADWKPLTILHLSDIHSGPFMRFRNLERVITRVNKKNFDLCVVTGDVVNHSAVELGWTLSLLEKLNSKLGTFASIGNHEYIDDEKYVIETYKKSQIELLLDSSKLISNGSSKIRLIGVDYPFDKAMTGKEEIQSALSKSLERNPKVNDELQILLSHHPNGFNVAHDLGIPVTLAGHTHGGQIQIGSKNIAGSFNKYLKGLYQIGSSFLYVNSGLGNWMPFRINVPCEYALITIEGCP